MAKALRMVGVAAGAFFALVVVATVIYFVVRPKPPRLPENVSEIQEVEAYLTNLINVGIPPGLSVVVVKEDSIVYQKGAGYADGPNAVPATPDTVYRWWSMTKIPTAVAILQLHERGSLDIDDPVRDYLPFFQVHYPSENSEVITIRHLLNHSSGLPDNFPEVVGWMHLEDETPLDQTAFLKEVFSNYDQLKFEPGSRSQYTNVGYMVLGAIVEQVSGLSYEEYVLENIVGPLEMKNTHFRYTENMLDQAAVGSHPSFDIQSFLLPLFYDNLDDYIRERKDGRIWFNRFLADSNPPTGLVGPATDLARFQMAYLNGGKLDGVRILSSDTVEMMTHDSQLPIKKTGQTDAPFQGLGWEVYREGGELSYLEHGGGGPGFGSAMRLYPDRSEVHFPGWEDHPNG